MQNTSELLKRFNNCEVLSDSEALKLYRDLNEVNNCLLGKGAMFEMMQAGVWCYAMRVREVVEARSIAINSKEV